MNIYVDSVTYDASYEQIWYLLTLPVSKYATSKYDGGHVLSGLAVLAILYLCLN